MQPPLTGGCQCGAVRYVCDGAPLSLYVCHCRECRRQSASAFGISVEVPRTAFRLSQGAPTSWIRDTDSGHRLRCHFCPTCGSRLWHEADGEPSDTLSIKGGSLDQPPNLTAAIHVWVSRKLPGVIIPQGAPQFAEED